MLLYMRQLFSPLTEGAPNAAQDFHSFLRRDLRCDSGRDDGEARAFFPRTARFPVHTLLWGEREARRGPRCDHQFWQCDRAQPALCLCLCSGAPLHYDTNRRSML